MLILAVVMRGLQRVNELYFMSESPSYLNVDRPPPPDGCSI